MNMQLVKNLIEIIGGYLVLGSLALGVIFFLGYGVYLLLR